MPILRRATAVEIHRMHPTSWGQGEAQRIWGPRHGKAYSIDLAGDDLYTINDVDQRTSKYLYATASQFEASHETPTLLGWELVTRVHMWLAAEAIYVTTDSQLTPADVRALVNEQINRRKLALQKAHALQAISERLDVPRRRTPLPQEVKVAVWQRDMGRCVNCESQQELEFDHIIPLAMGGSNTVRNIQLLCAACNRRKGASLG